MQRLPQRGTAIGIPQISGMEVVVGPDTPWGKRVITATVKGKLISPDRKYLLAHTDAETLAGRCRVFGT